MDAMKATMSNLVRFGEQTIWSTLRLPAYQTAMQTVHRLFQTPVGQQGQGFQGGLSVAETNMKEGGRLSWGLACRVHAVTWTLWGEDGDSVETLWHNAAWMWEFTQTVIDGSTLDCIDPQAFADLAAMDDLGRAALLDRPGHHVRIGMLKYDKVPVHLPKNVTFGVTLRIGWMPIPQSDVFARVNLHTTYEWPVELG